MRQYKISVLFILLLQSLTTWAYSFQSESVLNEGKWVKIAITESGIHKLTYEDIKAFGFDNPGKVHVYGYGGAQLPENLTVPKSDDLPLVTTTRVSASGNSFGAGDYILFWGVGPVTWNYSATDKSYIQSFNTYSQKGYYFLSDRVVDNGKELSNRQPVTSTPTETIDTYLYPLFHEKDEVTVSKTGTIFAGENFSYKTAQSFSFPIPGLKDDVHNVAVTFIASKPENTIQVNANDVSVGRAITSRLPEYHTATYYSIKGKATTAGQSGIKIDITLRNSGDNNAYLDYIVINAKRELKLYNGYVNFKVPASNGIISKFEIGGASASTQLWDVTSPQAPQRITDTTLSGNTLSFVASKNQQREYVAFTPGAVALKPTFAENIQNQNLHALPFTDYVIIAPKGLLPAAERLAQYHREQSGLHVTVVTDKQIYNEYSSGTPDATAIRWFLKQFHERARALATAELREANRTKYLLLFGDCLVDNRGVTKVYESAYSKFEFLLSYQLPESLNEGRAVMTDDYFGYLDDAETKVPNNGKIDIGIGRFPVRTMEEANNAINKTISYAENKELGSWKNRIVFVADDGSVKETVHDYLTHMSQAEHIINTDIYAKKAIDPITNNVSYPNRAFIAEKIYFDRYEKVKSSSTGRYPDVEEKLMNSIHSGAMLINYIGHGSTAVWADENVLDVGKIKNMYNAKLPLIITATCDFSRFDDFNTSAGEEFFLHPKGGGIALITTTRIAYTGTNLTINSTFCSHIFDKKKNGERMTLGEIMYNTKQSLTNNSEYLNFALLGDPAIKLCYPEYKARVTNVNSEVVADTINFRALQRITIEGEIVDPLTSMTDETFTGIISPTIFDAEQSVTTRGNFGEQYRYTFNERNTILFTGKDSIKNGHFKFAFQMPRDISYSDRSGMINLYANGTHNREAQGYFDMFRIGGTDQSVENDFEGPEISPIYLNTATFKEGDAVNASPLFFAHLKDNVGFNLSTTGVGHDLSLVIDNDYAKTYSLNSYFESVPGSATEGYVRFKIPTLKEGTHTLTFRAWDTFNNSSSRSFTFNVSEKESPNIMNLRAAKSPVSRSSEQAKFILSHDRPNTEITVRLGIYNISGVEVWSHTEKGMSDLFSSYPIYWNFESYNGAKVQPGVYLFRATISTNNSNQVSETKKIIITQ